ncbi:AMP-binding enzyme [Colletotrichum tofieldiae]|nr:AMP-binding enzyme [Colletotrichum tofieldiae]
MIPVQIVVLDRLPLNANGKIDRRELTRKARAAPRTKVLSTERVEPRNEVEAVLCEEFSVVLGADVGITDNFFDLGGHSLLATRLAARLSRRFNTQISVKDIFDQARIIDLAATVRQGSSKHNAIKAEPYSGPVEQSFAQGRLWFLDQFDLGASWYIMPLAVRLRGSLNVEALTAALHALELRHETLRTTFEEHDGVGVQVVHPYDPKELRVFDVSADYTEALQKEQNTPFDLAVQPGWRPALFRLGDQDYILSIVMHHIIYDGWSLEILQRELAAFYASAVQGQDPLAQVLPLSIQYRDFAVWQKQEAQVAEHERQLSYWRQQLEGSQPASLLCDKSRPATLSGDAGFVSVSIEGSTYENLHAYCRARQATPFTVLLAAFRAAHYRLTGVEDATIGTPIANRNRSELEDLVGFFVNTQCMRITIEEEDETFESLVQQVRATVNTAFENQDVPFERIVSALQPGSRDTSRNPLVQIMFAVHSQQAVSGIQLENVTSERVPNPATTRFDIEFHLFQERGRITASILYATELFTSDTIRSVVNIFQEVLRRSLQQPEATLSSLPLTDGLVELRNMGLLSVSKTAYPRDASVVDLFREQALNHPESPAVIDASSSLTYSQLDQQSNRLAAWLQLQNLADESLVGVLAPRSCDTIVAFLGILKANLGYLPLDINVPAARLEAILSAVPGRKLLLLGADVPVPESALVDVELVRIGEALKDSHNFQSTASRPSSTSLAYVMFTSGSTGKPKGVMVEHRGIVRLVKNSTVVSKLPQAARMAHLSNVAFDAATWEIYTALLNGGTLVCVDYFTTLDSKALQSLFKREKVQAAIFPPALLKQCINNAPAMLHDLDLLLTGGDRFDSRDAVKTKALVRGSVYNAYGPTENTVISTVYEVSEHDSFANGVPVGRAVSNSGAYIMDVRQQPVPIGVMGELVVFGDGLARGYTDSALDAGRFVDITVDGQPPTRAYRTGDRVRYRPDGQIEFFGRMDQQVKIRGHRVEPAEVEQAILKYTAAFDSVVVLRKQEGQEPEIVSFVAVRYSNGVAPEHADAKQQQFAAKTEKEMHQKLQSALPPYMVPAQIIVLDQLPLNANGKVDRRLLAHRAQTTVKSVSAAAESARVAPRNDVEAALCEEFTNVLGVEVGVQDSFFDLGGHSLMATKLVARLSRRLNAHVSVKAVFEHPVLADLAATIRTGSKKHSPIQATDYSGPVEQSFAQARLWFIDQLELGASYIMPLALRMRGPLSVNALNLALHALAQRHETLRTTFEEQGGVGVQIVHKNKSSGETLRVIDVSGEDDEAYVKILQKEQATPFNLAAEAGWRVALLRLNDEDHILSIVMHHIISDGWSIEVIQRELVALYAAAIRGQNLLTHLSPLAIHYRDFTVWQKQETQMAEHDRQLEYWTKQLQGGQPARLRCDKPRPAVLSGSAGAVSLSIEGEVYESLQTFCRIQKTTSFAVLLAAFRAAHYRLTGADDATIGTPIANRNRPELEDIIGFFVNTQCMRIVIDDNETFGGLVQQVRSTATAAFENQDVPFERVVSALLPGSRDTSCNPLVQLMFTLNSQQDLGKIQLEGITSEVMSTDVTTRFDVEFHLFQEAGRLSGTVVYSTDLFERETIHGIVDIFQEVLHQALVQPDTPLAALPFARAQESLRNSGLLDVEVTKYPREASVTELFCQQAVAHPNAVAVTDEISQLTYAELDQQSDKLANWLRQRHLSPETLVGVLAPRSCETVIAFIGILKANLAYLPLDVNVPTARVEAILSSIVGQKLVLVGPDVSTDVALPDVDLVRISTALGDHSGSNGVVKRAADPVPQPDANSLAYVIFTSGSTGKPKGVMVEHRGIVRLVKETNLVPQMRTTAVVAHISNLAFDAATWEIYAPLLNGGMVVCIDHLTVLNSADLGRVLSSKRVSAAFFTTALLKQFLEETPSIISGLDLLFAGGEWMRPQDAQKAVQLVRHSFCHVYGPTENTTFSTMYPMHPKEQCANGVPIGRAISNSGAYIMDLRQQLVPVGVMGELVVTGDGLARGYTDATLDLNRFVNVTIAGQVVRAYRTGDRARFRPTDGQIEFYGRMDQQVKVRGHRIEPAEIEQAMLSYSGVGDAIVVLSKSEEGRDPELVGFFTAAQNTNGVVKEDTLSVAANIEKELRRHLQNVLPSYMVPARISRLDQLPLNPNGKVDRRDLLQRAQTVPKGPEASTRTAPTNDIEAALCDEFASVLGVELGITDSFFDLGGHSLMATKLSARLSRRFHTRVSVKDIFDHPVIVDLAASIQQNSSQHKPIEASEYSGPVEQSFAQGRLWFLEQLNLGVTGYLVPLAARLRDHCRSKPSKPRCTLLSSVMRPCERRSRAMKVLVCKSSSQPTKDSSDSSMCRPGRTSWNNYTGTRRHHSI